MKEWENEGERAKNVFCKASIYLMFIGFMCVYADCIRSFFFHLYHLSGWLFLRTLYLLYVYRVLSRSSFVLWKTIVRRFGVVVVVVIAVVAYVGKENG